jgi:hypothetical protein
MKESHGMQGCRRAAIVALTMAAGTAHAQVWTVNSGVLSTRAEAFTQQNGIVTCNIIQDFTGPPAPMAPGYLGNDLGQFVSAGCGTSIFICPLSGYAFGDVRIDGTGTPLLRMRWRTWTNARHICADTAPLGYRAFGEVMPFNPQLVLDVFGPPNGTPVQVDYGWSNRSAAFSRSEAGAEDQPSFVTNTSLAAGGVGDLFALAGFNFDIPFASGYKQGAAGGQFNQTVGAPWPLDLTGNVRSEINSPGKGFANKDVAGSFHVGELWLTLDPILFPIPPGVGYVPNPTVLFSLDIGSDTELSPPVFDGDEVFDPGDLYTWFGPFMPGPLDGVRDDDTIFAGIDPFPDPLTPLGPPNSAPTCAGAPIGGILRDYFDLDGADCTDFNLGQFIDPIFPAAAPINGFTSSCVWEATNLIWSYEDDGPSHYTGSLVPFPFCETPTNSLSPFAFSTWGTAAAQDEVMSGLIVSGLVPTPMGAQWGVASEALLHPNLSPDPDFTEDDDDDVDALDVVGDVLADGTAIDCPFWYFSADHEAIAPPALDPGDVYLVTPAGPVLAVDAQVHLGLLPGVDLDAFEFAFVRDQLLPGPVLALLFSVDDDDPLTPADESGGLNPAMVYVSYLTGASQPFLTNPLDDDIDGLSVYADALPPAVLPQTDACCFCTSLCSDLTPNDCLIAGGIPQGPGTSCIAGLCEAYGACCFGGVCIDNMTPTVCAANGGVYQGDCIPCAVVQCIPVGACCFTCAPPGPNPPCPNPVPLGAPCVDGVTQADCTNVLHGIYRGDGTTCIDPMGNAICRCIGDINGDGVTNAADFVVLAGNFGAGVPNCVLHTQGDLNCDGVVNAADFTILAGNFGCQ